VSGRHSAAALTLADLTPLAKVGVRARPGGAMAQALGVPFGRAARDSDSALVTGSGPGEWLVLGQVGGERALVQRLEQLAARTAASELVSVIDLTHGRALMRLTGAPAAGLLAKVCGIDLSDPVTPDGAAFRSSVAKLVTDVVRDDTAPPPGPPATAGPVRSYLLHCDRGAGQYLFDALLDAGAEFGIDTDGLRDRGI
jgi:heterotetrameric sarcosine oxidase gamma subunit